MLDFNFLHNENIKRCEESFHGLYAWTPTDWACAMAGEMGEACNIIKKMRRLVEEGCPWDIVLRDRTEVHKAADELADVVIYADLLAARMGTTLKEAIIRKFNEVSERVGSPRWL